METNKLKPYLFWIICGVLLLIELVYFGFFESHATSASKALIRQLMLRQQRERRAHSEEVR